MNGEQRPDDTLRMRRIICVRMLRMLVDTLSLSAARFIFKSMEQCMISVILRESYYTEGFLAHLSSAQDELL